MAEAGTGATPGMLPRSNVHPPANRPRLGPTRGMTWITIGGPSSRATTTADLDGESVRDLLTATYRPREAAAASRVTLSLDLLRFRVSGSAK